MKKSKILRIVTLVILIMIANSAFAQEKTEPAREEPVSRWEPTVLTPINLYDTFTFDEKNQTTVRTSMYIFGPAFVTVWGLVEWGWFSGHSFKVHPTDVWGADALDGGSDKLGHMFGAYTAKRAATFLFRASGDSRLKANLMGAAYAEVVTLILEFGDGLSTAYGFDPWDVVGNNVGILAGFLLDQFPVLDRMFALQCEWIPSKKFRKNFEPFTQNSDVFTDYSGQKILLATKLGGIPYLSRTPLRYLNVDLGYYARGYYNNYYKSNTQNLYLGLSVNYSIAFGDLLPTGYTSSTFQSIFNYYHVPLTLEAKKWELVRVPNNDEF
ncbi:MAG: DUF2279 domain-containing protein [Spirochaetes bacterium]|nr:MAG: DUF2279 domain-containing protein [Spirochaetota bacterium]